MADFTQSLGQATVAMEKSNLPREPVSLHVYRGVGGLLSDDRVIKIGDKTTTLYVVR